MPETSGDEPTCVTQPARNPTAVAIAREFGISRDQAARLIARFGKSPSKLMAAATVLQRSNSSGQRRRRPVRATPHEASGSRPT